MNSLKRRELVCALFNDATFNRLSTNQDRVQYVLRNLMSYDEFRAMAKANLELAQQKSTKSMAAASTYATKAKMFIQLAKTKSDASHWQSALKSYDKAILYAPTSKIDFLSQLNADKSKAHFEVKNYQAALYAVDLAIQIRKEAKKKDKFEDRRFKVKCLMTLNQRQEAAQLIRELLSSELEVSQRKEFESLLGQLGDDEDFQDVIGEPQQSVAYQMDQRCRIVNSPVVGRHLVATEDIPENVQLITEKAYSIVIEEDYMVTRCHQCYLELGHKFYPCEHCIDLVFCDRDCFRAAYDSFHRFECGFVQLVQNVFKPSLHIFRMMSRVGPLEAFEARQSLDRYSMDDYLAVTSQRVGIQPVKTAQDKMAAYKMASILCDNDDKHDVMQNAHHTIVAIETATLLDLAHGISHRRPEPLLHSFIAMIITDVRRITFNVFGWQEFDADGHTTGIVGQCLCLVSSLVNHSCTPNTTWMVVNGELRFTTNRAIAKDTQVTITYGPYQTMDHSQRQKQLNSYFFACNCHACYKDSLQDDNLRCRSCAGPVLFNSPANELPVLNGRCLLCSSKYENFAESIEALKRAKEEITELEKLTKLQLSKDLEASRLEKAIVLTKKIVDLSLPSSKQVVPSIVACSLIIERMADQLSWNYSWAEKAQLALLFDSHLPVEIAVKMIDGAFIANLRFWLQLLIDCIAGPLSSRPDCEHVALWNAMFTFYYRLNRSIESLGGEAESVLLKKLLADQLEKSNQAVEQCKHQYGGHLQFRIFSRYRYWARLGRGSRLIRQ